MTAFQAADATESYKAQISTVLAKQPSAVTTTDLLAIALDVSSETANQIINACSQGSILDQGHLYQRLATLQAGDLSKVKGLNAKKLERFAAVQELGKRMFTAVPHRTTVDNPEMAASIFKYELSYSTVERFAVAVLNVKHELLDMHIIGVGTADSTIAHPRDIFGRALKSDGSRIIVAHNHPSGHTEPSPEDISLTKMILQSGQLMGIAVLDHIIIGGQKHNSLRQTTDLWGVYPQGD